jgi:hypothetical protein
MKERRTARPKTLRQSQARASSRFLPHDTINDHDHEHIPFLSLPRIYNSPKMAGVSQLVHSQTRDGTADSSLGLILPLQASLPSHNLTAPPLRTNKTNVGGSAIFRRNFTMLGAVFVSAFGMQMYVVPRRKWLAGQKGGTDRVSGRSTRARRRSGMASTRAYV